MDDFRNRLGWHMERVAGGERIRVTRRGKPYVRVAPDREQARPRTRGVTSYRSGPAFFTRYASRPQAA